MQTMRIKLGSLKDKKDKNTSKEANYFCKQKTRDNAQIPN